MLQRRIFKMNYLVFDTETTSLEKPFCYNVGYVIASTETGETLIKRSFVVDQIWYNLPLFSSAYFADKRPLYVSELKGRKTLLEKWGYICQQIKRDIKAYNIQHVYAYNSPFDEKVFDFNCDWFKNVNPLESVQVHDIRGYVHKVLAFSKPYQDFCIANELFTESGNISTTAEAVYRFITYDMGFDEEHTALADSEIENEILKYCVSLNAKWEEDYKVYRSVPYRHAQVLKIVDTDGEVHEFDYYTKTTRKDTIYLKGE